MIDVLTMTKVRENRFVTEASDLRLSPGFFPDQIETKQGTFNVVSYGEDTGDLLSVTYKNAAGMTLVVLND